MGGHSDKDLHCGLRRQHWVLVSGSWPIWGSIFQSLISETSCISLSVQLILQHHQIIIVVYVCTDERLMPRLPGTSLGRCLPINPGSWLTVSQRSHWHRDFVCHQPACPGWGKQQQQQAWRKDIFRGSVQESSFHHCQRVLRRKVFLKRCFKEQGDSEIVLVGAFLVKFWWVCPRQMKKTKVEG